MSPETFTKRYCLFFSHIFPCLVVVLVLALCLAAASNSWLLLFFNISPWCSNLHLSTSHLFSLMPPSVISHSFSFLNTFGSWLISSTPPYPTSPSQHSPFNIQASLHLNLVPGNWPLNSSSHMSLSDASGLQLHITTQTHIPINVSSSSAPPLC